MNNTNNSTEARIENCNIRIAKLKSELKACVSAATRCILKTKIEVAETTLSRLLDSRDNQILTNKIAGLVNSLSVGKSIKINPAKLVTATTFENWKKITVTKSVIFGKMETPEISKLGAEILNAKDFLHKVRHCYTVEKTENGCFTVTRKAYRKAVETGFSTEEDMVLDFFGML